VAGALNGFSKNFLLFSISVVLILGLFASCSSSAVMAQALFVFKPSDIFSIPQLNSTISFTLNGTYEYANMNKGAWNFVNLLSNDSDEPLNLTVSAQDSNVTILSYLSYNVTFQIIFLSYYVEGRGEQSFNLSLPENGGDWSVMFNRDFIGENEGWNLSGSGTLTVSGASSGSNVTLTYFVYPASLGGEGNDSNLPFYQQHSVVIVTAVAVAITVALAVSVAFNDRRKRRKALASSELASIR